MSSVNKIKVFVDILKDNNIFSLLETDIYVTSCMCTITKCGRLHVVVTCWQMSEQDTFLDKTNPIVTLVSTLTKRSRIFSVLTQLLPCRRLFYTHV